MRLSRGSCSASAGPSYLKAAEYARRARAHALVRNDLYAESRNVQPFFVRLADPTGSGIGYGSVDETQKAIEYFMTPGTNK